MSDDYIQRTLRAYDDALRYEAATKNIVPEQELQQLATYLPQNALVLDAGCGFGRDTKYLSDLAFEVCGIDLSDSLIARAKELHPHLKFATRDVRSTGFSDSHFDGIWCNATLLHLTDQDILSALAEFKRVLKPGGVLAVSFKKGEGTKSFVEKFSSDAERFFNFKTRESFTPMLNELGFREIESHYLNEQERYGADKRDLDWLYSFSKSA